MRKNNTDSPFTPGLLLMCAANFLTYASVYMVQVLLPLAVPDHALTICPAFIIGMLVSGPFHAYLADTFRRKHVLQVALAGLVLSMLAVNYLSPAFYGWLAGVQGLFFGMATSAGITISIDITLSGHRTCGNMAYGLCGRLGMVAGLMLGVWAASSYPALFVTYASAILGGVALLLVSVVYVSFRAPIGVRLCSIDRFFLPRAWLPALYVGVLAFAFGMCGVSLTWQSAASGSLWMLVMLPLALLVPPVVKMFVKLSHHCQRATGNMTFHLMTDIGLIAGVWTSCAMDARGYAPADETRLMADAFILAALLAIAVWPYYKKKRVR